MLDTSTIHNFMVIWVILWLGAKVLDKPYFSKAINATSNATIGLVRVPT